MRIISIIEHSSIITTSHFKGLFSSFLHPFFWLYSNKRCKVLACMPVVSVNRLAALPVGAAKRIRYSLIFNAWIIPTVVVVFPVPGPPVIIVILFCKAHLIAFNCISSYWIWMALWTPPMLLFIFCIGFSSLELNICLTRSAVPRSLKKNGGK